MVLNWETPCCLRQGHFQGQPFSPLCNALWLRPDKSRLVWLTVACLSSNVVKHSTFEHFAPRTFKGKDNQMYWYFRGRNGLTYSLFSQARANRMQSFECTLTKQFLLMGGSTPGSPSTNTEPGITNTWVLFGQNSFKEIIFLYMLEFFLMPLLLRSNNPRHPEST